MTNARGAGWYVRRAVRALVEHTIGRYCPICESRPRKFLPAGTLERSKCPICGSYERHRLAFVALQRHTSLFDGQPRRILHVAPEETIAKLLRELPGANYRSCDLDPNLAQDQIDLTAMAYADASFDFIYCSHVLEHIPEDALAMRELRRVLAPNGFALIMVPIFRDVTEEDPSVTDPDERARRYGQFDHVRVYGEDFLDRLRAAGFELTVVASEDVGSQLQRWQMSLYPGERAFIARPVVTS